MDTASDEPTTTIVEPEIFLNEYGREFIRYVWYGAEIAIVQEENNNVL